MVETAPARNQDQPPNRVRPTGKTGIMAWWVYDWANSAFGTLITTFIFGPYFIAAVAPDPTQGTVWWGWASGAAALLIALAAPILGAVADQGGGRKRWLLAATAMCIVLTALLYGAAPSPDYVLFALIVFVGALVASELSLVFYNSMLPGLAPAGRTGVISGWGYGIGYLGGVAALSSALFLLVGDNALFSDLDRGGAEDIRATAWLVALWYAVFALPLFIFTPEQTGRQYDAGRAIGQGVRTLIETFRKARRHANTFRYLIAFLFYSNGVSTIFAFGGIYAVGTFGMTMDDVIVFAIVLNVAAGSGAAMFGWLDDRIGAKPVILVALGGLIVSGTVLVLTASVVVFWGVGIVLGLLIGGAQTTSRSLMAQLVPKAMEAEMFGLYALSGKATAFAGPIVLAFATDIFDSQRAGMATILVFFIVGLSLLIRVKAPGTSQHHNPGPNT